MVQLLGLSTGTMFTDLPSSSHIAEQLAAGSGCRNTMRPNSFLHSPFSPIAWIPPFILESLEGEKMPVPSGWPLCSFSLHQGTNLSCPRSVVTSVTLVLQSISVAFPTGQHLLIPGSLLFCLERCLSTLREDYSPRTEGNSIIICNDMKELGGYRAK